MVNHEECHPFNILSSILSETVKEKLGLNSEYRVSKCRTTSPRFQELGDIEDIEEIMEIMSPRIEENERRAPPNEYPPSTNEAERIAPRTSPGPMSNEGWEKISLFVEEYGLRLYNKDWKFKKGRWTKDEHMLCVEARKKLQERDSKWIWMAVSMYVCSKGMTMRSKEQCKSHFQKKGHRYKLIQ